MEDYGMPVAPYFAAPAAYDARWDDPGYDSPQSDCFAVMNQDRSGKNHRYGFVFHDACWCLLREASPAKAIPLDRLYDVLRSLPIVTSDDVDGVDWGHDYGGPPEKGSGLFPWEVGHLRTDETVEHDIVWSANPYQVTELEQLITEAPNPLPCIVLTTSGVLQTEMDPFSGLPYELCAAIAMTLPTSDVLNLRLASKSFWPMIHSQQFWRSRFGGLPERSWLFEARDGRQIQDWRWLYHQTSEANRSPGARNRSRVWKLLQTVTDLVNLKFPHSPIQFGRPLSLDTPGLTRVAADIREISETEFEEGGYVLDEGCCVFYKDHIVIPREASLFTASYVPIGDGGYITGIRFVTSSGSATVQSGYWGSHQRSVAVKGMVGFHLAVSPRGIQAIRCISEGDNVSQWLGYPSDCLTTRRLARLGGIESLELGFDGFKLVSLGAVE
ncbi:F-box domain-containing protein [Xylariomycetidae sp. FL2044]|nr:F-box domain-containing protein [Xylariomycetidae sp. FL2044]